MAAFIRISTGRFPQMLRHFRAETGSGKLSPSHSSQGKAKSTAHVAGFDQKKRGLRPSLRSPGFLAKQRPAAFLPPAFYAKN